MRKPVGRAPPYELVMLQEPPDQSSDNPYAAEPSTAEIIDEWVANRDGRYVLISRGGVEEGRAVIYDTRDRVVGGIDEGDELHREVVKRMLLAGAKVFAS